MDWMDQFKENPSLCSPTISKNANYYSLLVLPKCNVKTQEPDLSIFKVLKLSFGSKGLFESFSEQDVLPFIFTFPELFLLTVQTQILDLL